MRELDVLLVDESPMGLAILKQLVAGLGVRKTYACETVDAAKDVLKGCGPDFAIVDTMADGRGFALVRWVRTELLAPFCYMPILMTAGHTPQDEVDEAMSCGIDFLIKKPIAPQTLIERITWIARTERPFVFSDAYIGPERRGPMAMPIRAGLPERRAEIPLEVDEADVGRRIRGAP